MLMALMVFPVLASGWIAEEESMRLILVRKLAVSNS
jgi:hypothetical protein